MNKFYKNGELKDKIIIKAIKQTAEDYENGAILEAAQELREIVDAISDWEQDQ